MAAATRRERRHPEHLASIVTFGRLDDRIAAFFYADGKRDRTAANRAVLDEALTRTGCWVDADVVFPAAVGTDVGGIVLEWHRSHANTRNEKAMKNPLVLLLLLVFSTTLAAYAAQATSSQRHELAQAVADEIHSNPAAFHRLKAAEVGAAVVDGYNALADWRSPDRSQKGQVSFYLACDHWNVGHVSFDRALTPAEIESGDHPFGKPQGSKLLAELAGLETRNIAYLKPATGTKRC